MFKNLILQGMHTEIAAASKKVYMKKYMPAFLQHIVRDGAT